MRQTTRTIPRWIATTICGLFILPQLAWAENEGLPDLEKASEAKLAAEGLGELTKVIELLDSAMDQGLDKDNTEFAEQLLVASLLERATAMAGAILDRPAPDPRWRQIRQIAVSDLNRLLQLDDSEVQAHLLMGRLLSLPGGDREEARKEFDKVVANGAIDAKAKAKALIYRGNVQTDDDARLADYNRAVDLVPEDAEILRTRAMFHLRSGRHDEALVDLDKSLAIEPKHAATHEARGLALLMKEDYDAAIAAFDKAAELAPESATPQQNRARALALRGDFQGALDALDKAIELNPEALPAFLLRAQILLSEGKLDDAMMAVEDVLAIRPGLIQAIRMKAEILAATGRLDEAIKTLSKLSKQVRNDRAIAMQLGMFQMAAKHSRKAIALFSEVLERDPADVQALRSRGDAYLNVGEHAAAIEDYTKAVGVAPKHTGVLNNLAWVLATTPTDSLRNGKRAIELATTACELTEFKAAHILSTLAAAYAETGDFDKAVEWSTKAVDTSAANQNDAGEPANPDELAQLKKELESYQEKKPWRELNNEEEQADPTDKSPAEKETAPAPARTIDF